MWLYTFFIVNITTMVFVTAVYAFAYRFLRDRFYLGLSAGWLVNIIYLAAEIPKIAPTALSEPSSTSSLRDSATTVLLGLLPALIFHVTCKLSSHRDRPTLAFFRPLSLAFAAALPLFLGIILPGLPSDPLPGEVAFALLTVPASLYSAFAVTLVAIRLSYAFPEDEFGFAGRLLHGSWMAYALLQFLYPARLFEELRIFLIAAFATALLSKVLSIVGLLNLLRTYYQSADEQARHVSVIADLGNLAAGLHHDIATPLALIDTEMDTLSREAAGDRHMVRFIDRTRLPMRAIYAALAVINAARLNATDLDGRHVRAESARSLVNRAVNLFRSQFPVAPLSVFVPGADTVYVRAHGEMLTQAFLNILKNAHEAGATRVLVAIHSRGRDTVHLAFINDGSVMKQDELENCFRPGWSTKRQEPGRANVGMGLYMAKKYVTINRGSMTIQNAEHERGVEVSIEVPRTRGRREGDQHVAS